MNFSTRSFQHVVVAKRVKAFNSSSIRGNYEVVKYTSPLYPGIYELKFSIAHPSDKQKEMKRKPKYSIFSGTNQIVALRSALWPISGLVNYYEGKNISPYGDGNEFIILQKIPTDESISLFVAPNLSWKKWNKITAMFKNGEYDKELEELFQELQTTPTLSPNNVSGD